MPHVSRARYFFCQGTVHTELSLWSDVQVEPSVQLLYQYIVERGTIIPIQDYSSELLSSGDISKRVMESIRQGTSEWEPLVPLHVREQIKRLHLLGYREPSNGTAANGTANGVARKGTPSAALGDMQHVQA